MRSTQSNYSIDYTQALSGRIFTGRARGVNDLHNPRNNRRDFSMFVSAIRVLRSVAPLIEANTQPERANGAERLIISIYRVIEK